MNVVITHAVPTNKNNGGSDSLAGLVHILGLWYTVQPGLQLLQLGEQLGRSS